MLNPADKRRLPKKSSQKKRGAKPATCRLTPKAKKFIELYPDYDSPYDAGKAAGYKSKSAIWHLMRNPLVIQRIDVNAAARRKYRKVSEENIQDELSKMGFANILDFVDENGNNIQIKDLPRDVAAAVKKVRVRRRQTEDGMEEEAELELVDKKASLELLGKRLGMWDKKEAPGLGVAYIESLGRTVGPMGEMSDSDE